MGQEKRKMRVMRQAEMACELAYGILEGGIAFPIMAKQAERARVLPLSGKGGNNRNEVAIASIYKYAAPNQQ